MWTSSSWALASAVVLASTTTTTHAALEITDSGFLNGHLYERYTDPTLTSPSNVHSVSGLTWNQANLYAADLQPKCGRASHLVSITSATENDYTKLLVPETRAFIGLTDQDGYCYDAPLGSVRTLR